MKRITVSDLPFPSMLMFSPMLCLLLLVLWCQSISSAAVRMPRLFSNNMLLQREKPVPVWGWANPGEEVTVQFAGQHIRTVADVRGNWMTRLQPLRPSGVARELIVKGEGTTVTIRNVLVGDVWLCSGDFGVYYTLYGCLNGATEIAAARYPQIRLLKVESKSSNTSLRDVEGQWKDCTPESVADASALAYFFGRALHRETGIPIGLIDASYRYSVIQSWISPAGFQMIPELTVPREIMDSWDSTTVVGRQAYQATLTKVEEWLPVAERAFAEGKIIPAQPMPPAPLPPIDSNYWSLGELSNLYHGMIAPLMPFALRGAVWSIGESGSGRMDWNNYHAFMRGLVEGWRSGWGQGNFPVYFELTPAVGAASNVPGAGGAWARFREEQLKGLSIPNTGMAVTFDASDYVADERNRLDAGERLARWALANEYHRKLVYSGPLYRSHRVAGDRIILTFDHVGRGLMVGEKTGLLPARRAKDGVLSMFAIAGADKKWTWAQAKIVGKTVEVRSDTVPAPVAVRYAYANNPSAANLYNLDGLPAAPFRTDAW